jgi:hypothetical protein
MYKYINLYSRMYEIHMIIQLLKSYDNVEDGTIEVINNKRKHIDKIII